MHGRLAIYYSPGWFYPLESILQIKLEHIALLPFRFIKYAKDNIASKGDIKSIKTRFLESRLPPIFSTDENVQWQPDEMQLIKFEISQQLMLQFE